MTATLLGTVLFVFSFIFLFISVVQIKKSNCELNGISWMFISFVSILCYGTMVSGIINIVKIPVNIVSVGVLYLATAMVIQLVIRKDGQKQRYKWEWFDFIYVMLFALVVFLVAGSYFTSSLKLMFYNSDAAVHFKNAMYVLRNERLENMYFAPLHNALIMEVFMPFVAEVNLYKIYILIDAFMFLLECCFFVVVIRDYLTTKTKKVIGVGIALLYIFGYPMNSYLFSFFYWAVGVMLIGYMILMIKLYSNNEVDKRTTVIGMMLCCGALPVTYMLFGPVIYIASFLALMYVCKQKGKLISKDNILLALKIYFIPTLLSVYYCYFDYLRNIDLTAGEILNIDGGIYRELFINFVWTLPFVIYVLIKACRKKELDETIIFTLFIGGVTLIMCLLVYKEKMAAYYYYKFYYPIWLMFYILATRAIMEWWENSKDILISYALVFVFLACVCFGGIEQRVINSQTGLALIDRTSNLFDLYKYNIWLWGERQLQYSDEYFDICNYVIEDLSQEEKEIPLLATQENYSSCYWYEGITGQNSEEFYGWHYSFEEVKNKIENHEVDYFVVYKDSPIYNWHADYFEMFEFVYENERGFVAKVK